MSNTSGRLIVITAGIFALIGTVWGSITVLDSRYEMQQVHSPLHEEIQAGMESYSYTALKREIREIREDLWKLNGSDPERRQQLEWDLQDAIDRLCRQFQKDRECA